jgi:hypothetical protein
MDSLDAQCLLMQRTEGKLRAPELWRHDRSGELSCWYDGGEGTFTWAVEDVAEMARSWRNADTNQVPDQARLFRGAHERLISLAGAAGLPPADAITHDLVRREIRAIWENEKLVVIVDEIPDGVVPASAW